MVAAEQSLLRATASLKFAWTEDGFEAWSNAIEVRPPTTSILGPEEGPYGALAFSRDGARLAVAGKDAILVIDGASLGEGTQPKILARLPQAGVGALAFKSTDSQVLVGAGQTATVWSLVSSRPVAELPSDDHSQFLSLAFDSQGKKLATAGNYYYARVFDAEAWAEIGRVGDKAVESVAFGPDDRWLLTDGGEVIAWNIDSAMSHVLDEGIAHPPPGSFFVVDEHGGGVVYSVSLDREGRWLAHSGGLRRVKPSVAAQDFGVGEKIALAEIIAVSPDARLGATKADYSGDLAIWSIDPEQAKPVEPLGRIPASSVAFAPTGEWLITATEEGLERWDLAAGAEWRRLVHGAGVLDVAIGPGGRFLATTTADGFVHVWETRSWREAFKAEIPKMEGDDAASEVAFSPDGRWFAAASKNIVKIFSTDDWRQAAGKDFENNVDRVVFSPDSKWLALNQESRLTLMAANSWTTSTFAHESADDISFGPDGRELAISRRPSCQQPHTGAHSYVWRDGLAQIWDISSGERRAEVPIADDDGSLACKPERRDNPSTRHDEPPQDVSWREWKRIALRVEGQVEWTSPDGAWIVKHGSGPDTIELRAARASAQMGVTHRAGALTSVAFSPDGKWFATAGNDGAVRIWTLDRDAMIAESCARLRRNLSPDEWRRILGDEPYSPVCPGLPQK